MMKTLIAGVTATALTLTTAMPAQADTQEDQLGKLLFGIIATTALVKIIQNHDKPRSAASNVVPKISAPRVHLPRSHPPRVAQNRRMVLPHRCAQHFRTRAGELTLFPRACIAQHYTYQPAFPRNCERDVTTRQGFRSGWDARCMQLAGYVTDRRR